MPRKPPQEERRIILARDHRRRYGARLVFRVLEALHLGSLENVTLLFPDGTHGGLRQKSATSWELGVPYELELSAYATAAEAEAAGLRAAQALLLTSISLDFGLRLEYLNHQPATVHDRTVTTGIFGGGRAVASRPETVVVKELTADFDEPVRDRRILLSMELLAASALEANDRARFVTAVSALEPLASTQDLGPEVTDFVLQAVAALRADTSIPQNLRASLEGRLRQLRRESVRQALARLSKAWFPDEADAAAYLDYVYALRSEILHEGAVNDLDVLLGAETRKVRQYLRRIYEREFNRTFVAPTVA